MSSALSSQHMAPLDGLRGLAILSVMLVHLSVFRPTTPLEFGVYTLTYAGWIGVELFFVLKKFPELHFNPPFRIILL